MYLVSLILPKSWENIIVAIISDSTKQKMDNLIVILLSKEVRRNSMNFGSQDAMHVRGRSKEKGLKGIKKRENSKGP